MTAKKKDLPVPEWSHPVHTDDIGPKGLNLSISPDAEATKRLEKRFGLVSLDHLKAQLEFRRDKGSRIIHVTGEIDAKVTQTCVVTLEPMQTEINEEFEAWYADPAEALSFAKARHERKLEKGNTETPILEEHEDPEPIINGQIDAGDLAAQYLSLAIDLYPVKPGARSESEEPAKYSVQSEVYKNPFAALKNWKAKTDKRES